MALTPQQKAQLEAELAANMARSSNESVGFSVPDLGAIPGAIKNIGQSALNFGSSLLDKAAQAEVPVFNPVPLKEKLDMIKQAEDFEKQEKDFQGKYKDFDPLTMGLEEFRKKYFANEPTPPENTPVPVAEDVGMSSTKKTVDHSPIKARALTAPKIASKAEQDTTPYDLQATESKPNTAYSDALRKAEEGASLANILQASNRIARSIAGSGRLSDATHNFAEVAATYGEDKRILDAEAKRKEVDAELAKHDANSNLSRAAQQELAELLKLEGRNVKDPAQLARMSAADLGPSIALMKQRQTLKREQELAQFNKDKFDLDQIFRYDNLNLQREMHAENVNARLEAAKLRKEEKESSKKQETLLKQEDKVKQWLSSQNNKMAKLRDSVNETKTNASRVRALLNQPINSVEQINQIYQFIKNLDNTAVREGEIRLFREGQNVFEELEVLKSKLTKDPKVISKTQFHRLANLVLEQADKVDNYYSKNLRDFERQFGVQADRLLKENPEYYATWAADYLDPEFRQELAARQDTGPSGNVSDATMKRVQSMTPEEQQARYEELIKKHRNK